MNGKEAFEKIMREEGYTRQAISAYMSESPQHLNQQLGHKVADLKTERLSELLNAVGWDIAFKKIGYHKVSREYITNLANGLADEIYGEKNEKTHRDEVFCTCDDGYAVLDNRDNEDRKKSLIEFQTEEQMMMFLKILTGEAG